MKEIVKSKYISSLTEYISETLELTKNDFHDKTIFRGQFDSSWTLLPKIARIFEKHKPNAVDFYKYENNIIDEFRRWIPKFNPNYPTDLISAICLGQHYGLNTRLLDWSQNSLTALWFALNNLQPTKNNLNTNDAVVWILKFNDKDIFPDRSKKKHGNSLEKLKRTKILYPAFNDSRITAQSSIFTIHQLPLDHGTFIPLERNSNFSGKISKLIIPNKHIHQMGHDLFKILTKHMIFQDLPALCDDINKLTNKKKIIAVL